MNPTEKLIEKLTELKVFNEEFHSMYE